MLEDLANRALKAGVYVMGESISYIRGEDVWQIRGVFQSTHLTVDPDTGSPVSTQQPIVLLSGRDLSVRPKTGDKIAARGNVYRIRDVQPDGHTGFTLVLQKAG